MRWRDALLACLALACGCRDAGPELPVLMQTPAFELVDQRGAPFSSERLTGKVWIGDFIFTSCDTICPTMTTQLANVRRRLVDQDGELAYVSFSVDPERDDPPALSAFARRMRAEAPNWHFLTGGPDDVRRVVRGGFKQVMEDNPHDTSRRDILHSRRFILVDRQGRIRGFYEADDAGLASLVSHARALAGGS